jgi:hypothetical protein
LSLPQSRDVITAIYRSGPQQKRDKQACNYGQK